MNALGRAVAAHPVIPWTVNIDNIAAALAAPGHGASFLAEFARLELRDKLRSRA